MMRNASTAPSGVTLPPTSRKFAGLPPWYLTMSIVPIASPAPLTRQPIVPSSWMKLRFASPARTSAGFSSFMSRSAAIVLWRKSALSSKSNFASSTTTSPFLVTASGLTSARVASFSR